MIRGVVTGSWGEVEKKGQNSYALRIILGVGGVMTEDWSWGGNWLSGLFRGGEKDM